MSATLKVRVLDMHTLQLGRGERWIGLGLPWLARDIGRLLAQARGGTVDPGDAQRVAALRLVLAKLADAPDAEQPPGNALADALGFHRQARLVDAPDELPRDGPLVWCCTPPALLDLESLLAARDPQALLSILVLGDQGLIVGPVLETGRYCPLCFRYLTGLRFGLGDRDEAEERAWRGLGIALARTIERAPGDSLMLVDNALHIEPFVPYIGCPTCLPES